MADLYILIKPTSASTSLKNLATIEKDELYLKIPDSDRQDALDLLATVNPDHYCYADDVSLVSGSSTADLVLPKEAGK